MRFTLAGPAPWKPARARLVLPVAERRSIFVRLPIAARFQEASRHRGDLDAFIAKIVEEVEEGRHKRRLLSRSRSIPLGNNSLGHALR